MEDWCGGIGIANKRAMLRFNGKVISNIFI